MEEILKIEYNIHVPYNNQPRLCFILQILEKI